MNCSGESEGERDGALALYCVALVVCSDEDRAVSLARILVSLVCCGALALYSDPTSFEALALAHSPVTRPPQSIKGEGDRERYAVDVDNTGTCSDFELDSRTSDSVVLLDSFLVRDEGLCNRISARVSRLTDDVGVVVRTCFTGWDGMTEGRYDASERTGGRSC